MKEVAQNVAIIYIKINDRACYGLMCLVIVCVIVNTGLKCDWQLCFEIQRMIVQTPKYAKAKESLSIDPIL